MRYLPISVPPITLSVGRLLRRREFEGEWKYVLGLLTVVAVADVESGRVVLC